MAISKRARKKLAKNVTIIVVLVILSLISSIFFPEEPNPGTTSTTPQDETTTQIKVETTAPDQTEETQAIYPSKGTNEEPVLLMTMVDVGQADAFVFEQDGKVAVIDCGTEDTVENLIRYLNERKITTIHFLFGSHPHDDHMGGMAALLEEESITVDKVIMPDAQGIDSDWYDELEIVLDEGDYNIEFTKEGTVYQLGQATITVLEQQEGLLDELNNYSAIIKVTLGDIDVIMTGDAETAVERAVMESGQDISAEILKVGHHGSKTSTSVKFLDAVDPIYALISCEVGNQHKHPTEKVMRRLEERGIVVYRTDECGTVVLTITPTDVSFNCEPGDYLSGTELKEKVGKE